MLTPAQLQTLKTHLTANTSTVVIGGTTFAINSADVLPPGGQPSDEAAQKVASNYNQPASPNFFGNYRNVPLAAVKAAILFKNYTPNDVPPVAAIPSAPTAAEEYAIKLYTARAIFAQNLQLSINNLLLADTVFDATKLNLVSGIKDATNSDMPTGSAGSLRKGGWAGAGGVQQTICRLGTIAEKLFADTSGGNGSANTTAATFTFEGNLSSQDIKDAWEL